MPITMAANKPPREHFDVRTRNKEGSLSGREKEKKRIIAFNHRTKLNGFRFFSQYTRKLVTELSLPKLEEE